MVLKATTLSKGERNFTAYDYVDIAEGVSTIEYYAGNLDAGNPTRDTILSRKTFYSDDYTIGGVTTDTDSIITKNFVLTFKYPRIVEGNLIVNASIWANITGATATSIGIIATALKGAVSLDTVTKAGVLTFAAPGSDGKRVGLLLNISRTKFGPGDVLTLRIEITNSASTAGAAFLFADPSNRTDDEKSSGLDTRLSAYIPFVPEL